jgi:rhodanese-related sulfurtransferase
MNKNYIIPIIVLIGLSLALLLLPDKKIYKEMAPEELLIQVNSPSRFLSPDIVADRIIKKDPAMMLVDVRSKEEFLSYSLPGSLNIPLSNLADSTNLEILGQEGIDWILFSNDNILADQAWILGKRLGLENLFVMQGGINQWFENFFMTPIPAETQSKSDLELYQFRLGVRQFFTGGEVKTAPTDQPETIKVQPKMKKSSAEGGC